MTDDLLWLLALPLAYLIGRLVGYVIRREVEYREFRRFAPLLLAPPIANTTMPNTTVPADRYRVVAERQ